MHPVTKLMVPGPDCVMLPASGQAGPIPPGYFIHPDTGRVLPEAGNLGYDVQEATLVPTPPLSPFCRRVTALEVTPSPRAAPFPRVTAPESHPSPKVKASPRATPKATPSESPCP